MRYVEISEARRIGTGVHKKEIPQEYKHLPAINVGTTSLILEKDPETVIMLTKDGIKRDWLVHELGIAEFKGWHESYHPKLKNMPIYVLEMPKLYPLGPKTRKAARDLVKTYERIKGKTGFSRNWRYDILDLFYEYFDEYSETNTDEHALQQLVDFLSNYHPTQYEWDLRMGNLMQDKDENLVVLDPIADSEIIQAFRR